ncbi:unnamed protein product [Ectocarpus fasciculatus]
MAWMKAVGWANKGSASSVIRGRYLGRSKSAPVVKGKREGEVNRGVPDKDISYRSPEAAAQRDKIPDHPNNSVVGSGGNHGGGRARRASLGDIGLPAERRTSSVGSRLSQHVERFMKETGGSIAEGRHLAQLLQLEFRDVVRRAQGAEAEAVCLRDRVRKLESYRREKDAADRSSFAGMALAHSDASAELRSRLEVADMKIEESKDEKQALLDELDRREGAIAELERKVAKLTTIANVKREREERARRAWERRISAKWEAYWSVRCRRTKSVEISGTHDLSETYPGANEGK